MNKRASEACRIGTHFFNSREMVRIKLESLCEPVKPCRKCKKADCFQHQDSEDSGQPDGRAASIAQQEITGAADERQRIGPGAGSG
jgi:hypothetical protein